MTESDRVSRRPTQAARRVPAVRPAWENEAGSREVAHAPAEFSSIAAIFPSLRKPSTVRTRRYSNAPAISGDKEPAGARDRTEDGPGQRRAPFFSEGISILFIIQKKNYKNQSEGNKIYEKKKQTNELHF